MLLEEKTKNTRRRNENSQNASNNSKTLSSILFLSNNVVGTENNIFTDKMLKMVFVNI